jgi:DNA-binding LacI/PurR family transcriptional regulator
MKRPRRQRVKHREVFAALRREIQAGGWKAGARLPSEAELVSRFAVSRITVSRAVRDLQQAGLVERQAGAGTFVKAPAASMEALTFGLLIPDFGETEIFEPICHGMMASPRACDHALIWGSASGAGASKEDAAWRLCRQYIDRSVAGVFFAPLEQSPDADEWNQRIGRALDEARIPLVLLDRTLRPYPDSGRHDVVGIDNRRAGFVMTNHVLRLGSRRIAFVGPVHAAATVDAREAGYREALFGADVPLDAGLMRRLNVDNVDEVEALMASGRPDAIVSANDRTAAGLMTTLRRLGRRIPADVRLVGIDDVDYARMLPVPLTTLRQPTHQIGETALSVMLERVARRDLVPRHVSLQARLVIRASCGAQLRASAQ